PSAAITSDRMTEGPAFWAVVTPSSTKMPVPMMPPMPSAVSATGPRLGRSGLSPHSASIRATGLVANRPGFDMRHPRSRQDAERLRRPETSIFRHLHQPYLYWAMRHALPPLEWLRGFEACARLRSFSRAADEIGITQAAMSMRIRDLEARLGTRLFHRTRPQITLTREGARLASQIRAPFDEL